MKLNPLMHKENSRDFSTNVTVNNCNYQQLTICNKRVF